MLKNIAKLSGIQQLKKDQQKEINGGSGPSPDNWAAVCEEYAQNQGQIAHANGESYYAAYFNAIATCVGSQNT